MKERKPELIPILLALLMTVSFLAGCSEKTSDTKNPEQSDASTDSADVISDTEADTYVYDSLDDMDFEGYKFHILPAEEYDKFITRDDYTGEPLNDAIYESRLAVEDRFNVTIVVADGGTDDSTSTIFKNSVVSNDGSFDMIIGHDNNTASLGTGGYLYDMMEVPQFDMDQPWWPKNTVESMTLQGHLYSASSYISYSGLHMTRATIINKDLAEEYNIEIPYDIVREGKWTFDTMYTYLEGYSKDLNGDGIITENDDQAALVAGSHSWYCIQEGAGVNIYKHDNEGNLYLDIDADKISEYIEKTIKITDPSFYIRATDMGETMFKNGRALFAFTNIGDAYDIYRHVDTRYGFLPSPKLNELQEDYINGCTDRLWGIPSSAGDDQIEIIGYICEGLSCSNFNRVIPAYFEVAMKARIADAPDDSEMLEIIRDTRTISFAYTFKLPLAEIHTGSRNESAASLIAKSSKSVQKMLDLFINNLD